jgi:hypothetical protein
MTRDVGDACSDYAPTSGGVFAVGARTSGMPAPPARARRACLLRRRTDVGMSALSTRGRRGCLLRGRAHAGGVCDVGARTVRDV